MRLYEREGEFYAGNGLKFVRLMSNHQTSKKRTSWVHIETAEKHGSSRLGRLMAPLKYEG